MFLSFLVPFIFHGIFDFLLMYLDKIRDVVSVFMLILVYLVFIAFDVFMWKMRVRNIKCHYATDIREIEQINNDVI